MALNSPQLLDRQSLSDVSVGGGLVNVLTNSRVISIFLMFSLHFKWKNQEQWPLQFVWSEHPSFPPVVQAVNLN